MDPDQVYWYGDTPPLGVAVIEPVEVPKHDGLMDVILKTGALTTLTLIVVGVAH